MNKRNALYEVWFSRGDGLQKGPRFRQRIDAERYVFAHEGEASFALRAPDGHWEQVLARLRRRRTEWP